MLPNLSNNEDLSITSRFCSVGVELAPQASGFKEGLNHNFGIFMQVETYHRVTVHNFQPVSG